MERDILEAILGSYSKIIESMRDIKSQLLNFNEKLEQRDRVLIKFLYKFNKNKISSIKENNSNLPLYSVGKENKIDSQSYSSNKYATQDNDISIKNNQVKQKIRDEIDLNIIKSKYEDDAKGFADLKDSIKQDKSFLISKTFNTPITSSINQMYQNPEFPTQKLSKLPQDNFKSKRQKYFDPEIGLVEEFLSTQKADNNVKLDMSFKNKILSPQKSFKKFSKMSQIHDPSKNSENQNTEFFNLIEKEIEETL